LSRLPKVLGEKGVDELVRWLDDRIAEQAVRRDEYREVLSRLDILEHDVSDKVGGAGPARRGEHALLGAFCPDERAS
jgi:hypothetical protein